MKPENAPENKWRWLGFFLMAILSLWLGLFLYLDGNKEAADRHLEQRVESLEKAVANLYLAQLRQSEINRMQEERNALVLKADQLASEAISNIIDRIINIHRFLTGEVTADGAGFEKKYYTPGMYWNFKPDVAGGADGVGQRNIAGGDN